MHKFFVRFLTCLIIFSFLIPTPAAKADQSLTASLETSDQIFTEDLSDFHDETDKMAGAPLVIPPPPAPPTPEEALEGKDPFHSKPPYPYYYYGTNSQPINLIPSANIILVNTSADCLSARQNLDLQFNQADISILTEDTFESTKYSMMFLSDQLPGVKSDQSLKSILTASETNCILPVFDRKTYYLYATDEIIVKFKPELSQVDLQNLITDYGLVTLDDNLGGLDMFLFQVTPSLFGNAYDLSNDLVEKGYAEFAHPNFTFQQKEEAIISSQITSDETITVESQWNLDKINASGAWGLLTQAGVSQHAVKVAVIDTGVQRSHEDLAVNIGPEGYDAIDQKWGVSEGEPKGSSAFYAHGTMVSGTIAANTTNNLGVSGVGHNFIQIIPVNIYDYFHAFKIEYMIRAIYESVNHGAKVINISSGLSVDFPDVAYPGLIGELLDAYEKGVVVVAASGNENESEVLWPAAYKYVIAVGATTQSDLRKECSVCDKDWGSNYGDDLDIVAPGDKVNSTDLMGLWGETSTNYSEASGTSLASPQVAAVAAMMLAANPNLTPRQVQDILQRTAVKAGPDNYSGRPDEGGWNKYMGFGRLNAYEAVRAVLNAPQVSFQIQLERIRTGGNHAVNVAIGVFGKYLPHPLLTEGVVATDASGHSVSNLRLPGITTGDYMVCAKPEHYLWRCLPTTITTGTITAIDFSSGGSYSFYAGDFGLNGEDGFINATDWELFRIGARACDHQWAVGYCAQFELLRDTQINSGDYLVLSINYNKYSDNFNYGGWYWRPFKKTLTLAQNYQNSLLDASITTGSIWMESSQVTPIVSVNFDVHVMMDLRNLSLGVGSTNLILHYDPGVLQVVDAYPTVEGIQITPGTLFPDSDHGLVDPVKGNILFGAMKDFNALSGISAVGELAMITFKPISAISTTEITPLFIKGESLDSNASEFGTGYDVIQSFSPLQFGVIGSPARAIPTVGLTVPQGYFINTYNIPVSVNINDPFNQVQSVQVEAWYDAAWHYISTDNQPADGWGVEWNTSGVTDQVIYLAAFGFLPGGLYGSSMTEGITLDRTVPTLLSHSFTPPSPSLPNVIQVDIVADDNLSGVTRIEMYVNDALYGSENGNWIFIGQVSESYGTFFWDSSGMEEGRHQFAFAIQDAAGNWNRWDDPNLPKIVYGQTKLYLPAIMR